MIAFTSVGQAGMLYADTPELNDDAVLVENEVSPISAGTERACLLDLPNLADSKSGEFPKYLGYSGVGRIVEIGKNIHGVEVGDRVLTH